MQALVEQLRATNAKLTALVASEESWGARPQSQLITGMAVGPLTKEVRGGGRACGGGGCARRRGAQPCPCQLITGMAVGRLTKELRGGGLLGDGGRGYRYPYRTR